MSLFILYFYGFKRVSLNIINVLRLTLQIIHLINHLNWFSTSHTTNNFLFLLWYSFVTHWSNIKKSATFPIFNISLPPMHRSLETYVSIALTGVPRLVEVLSCTQKILGFDSWSGHMPKLWVLSLVGQVEKQLTVIFLSHINVSLSLSLSLPFPFSKINNHVLRWW